MTEQSQTKQSDDKIKTSEDKIVLGKDAVYMAAIVVLLIVLGVSIITGGFGIVKPNTPPTNQNTTVITNTTITPTNDEIYAKLAVVNINTGRLQMLGDATAPITILAFSDYQCPYCSKFYSQSEKQIKDNYVTTGKAKMYFRDFPLEFHDKALLAATAARCAAEQSKFWEMHDILFSKQSEWSGLSVADATVKFEAYAAGLSLNATKYTACVTAGKDSAINSDYLEGQAYGISGTPTTFIIAPKDKTDLTKILAVKDAASDYVGLAKTPTGDYLIMVVGALPYSIFNELFGAISV